MTAVTDSWLKPKPFALKATIVTLENKLLFS